MLSPSSSLGTGMYCTTSHVQSAHPAVQGELVLKLLYKIMMFYWELVIIVICLVRPLTSIRLI